MEIEASPEAAHAASTERPITVRGVRYESTSAAARALGVSKVYLRRARRRGRLDGVGCGKGNLLDGSPRVPPAAGRPGPRSIPCTVKGVDYPSRAAAARALGISPRAVTAALAEGRADRVGWLKESVRAQPVEILGTRYPSLHAAETATGIRSATLRRHRDAGTLDEYARAALERAARGEPPPGSRRHAVVVDGTEYPSIGAAAAAHGMKAEKLRQRLKAGAARYRGLDIGYSEAR